jgi:argininosuccinate synthase
VLKGIFSGNGSTNTPKTGANAIAHGSAGAGNDQVRFDMAFRPFPKPKLSRHLGFEISREDEIGVLKSMELSVNGTSQLTHQGALNLLGGKETLNSWICRLNCFPTQQNRNWKPKGITCPRFEKRTQRRSRRNRNP